MKTESKVIELTKRATVWDQAKSLPGVFTLKTTKATAFFLAVFALVCLFLEGASNIWTDAKRIASEEYRAFVSEAVAEMGFVPLPSPVEPLTVREIVEREATARGVSPHLVHALMHTESGGRPAVMSHVGAVGLMQIMPQNHRRCGLRGPAELIDEHKNIRCGVQILSEELRATGGNVIKALRRYNGGPKCESGGCSESEGHWQKTINRMARPL